ncbi:UNVERIFIED_ORG: hypothetical protein GGI57_005481 [Rhizobium aethiopicum]
MFRLIYLCDSSIDLKAWLMEMHCGSLPMRTIRGDNRKHAGGEINRMHRAIQPTDAASFRVVISQRCQSGSQ